MFDRFTFPALQVVFHAREEAGAVGACAAEPEHVLFGVLEVSEGLGHRVLARSQGTLNAIQSAIGRRQTIGEVVPESQEIPLSAATKRVLQYASRVRHADARSIA